MNDCLLPFFSTLGTDDAGGGGGGFFIDLGGGGGGLAIPYSGVFGAEELRDGGVEG